VASTRREFVIAGASAAFAPSLLGRSALSDRPNVLVIVVDSLRADHAYGARARTPAIDSLARAGLSFTQVVPEGMPTVPVRNAILSGRRTFPYRGWRDHRGLLAQPGWSPLNDVGATWTSVLRGAGYWTGYVTDNPFLGFSAPYERLRRSFDLFVRRGGQLGGSGRGVSRSELEHWLHPSLRNARTVGRMRLYLAAGGYQHDETASFAARVFQSGATALERAAQRRPFALVVDTFEPHEPWTPPRRYLDLYGDPDWRGPEPGTLRYGRVSNWLGPREARRVLRRLRDLYAAEVTMTDRWLGVLLERLSDLGLERDTVIVLVSDHGIFLGERGWTGKISVALHPELVHVPLIVVDPGRRRAGQRTPYRASPHDLGRTLLSMTGVEEPAGMEGADLSALFRGELPARAGYHWGGYGNSHYLRSDRWTFFADNRMRRPHLYDRRRDPAEGRDVADRHPDVVRDLHERVTEKAHGRLPFYPQ
jgi:arylsulfatase A-like enzyme